MDREVMRNFVADGFRVHLFDIHKREDGTGRNLIEFVIYDDQFDKDNPVIGPVKKSVPVTESIDGDGTLCSCLHWHIDDFKGLGGRTEQWVATDRPAVLYALWERFYYQRDEFWAAYKPTVPTLLHVRGEDERYYCSEKCRDAALEESPSLRDLYTKCGNKSFPPDGFCEHCEIPLPG